jgi:hypothetical protein
MYSPELQSQMAQWRQKCREGTMTTEDYKKVLAALRDGRASAATTSEGSRKRAKAAATPVDTGMLLGRLKGLK